MSNQKESKPMPIGKDLKPRLRFPSFQAAWKSSLMSTIYSFKGNNSLSRNKLNYTSGIFKNIHYGDIHTRFSKYFHANIEQVPYINNGESHPTIRTENYCIAGDMVFADASEDIIDIGKAIEIIDAGSIPLVSGLHTILARPKRNHFTIGFGAYLFSSEGIRKQIRRESQGCKVLSLSPSRLGNVLLYFPKALEEQQKIIGCLSSLDNLIAARSRRLDNLKTYKKGLMQQLFPTESNTMPRLRFPEFRDASEWARKTLSDVCKKITNGQANAEDHEEDGVYPLFDRSDVIKRSNDFAFNDEAVIIPGEGVRFHPKYYQGKFNLHQRCYALIQHKGNAKFIYYTLDYFKDALAKYAVKSTVLSLRLPIIENFILNIPRKDEQQKIANCLSSLDDLIAAENRRLDNLKAHKKGLMQQLFPTMNEVNT